MGFFRKQRLDEAYLAQVAAPAPARASRGDRARGLRERWGDGLRARLSAARSIGDRGSGDIEVFYNGRRRHSSIGYIAPAESERRYYEARAAQGNLSTSLRRRHALV